MDRENFEQIKERKEREDQVLKLKRQLNEQIQELLVPGNTLEDVYREQYPIPGTLSSKPDCKN